MSSFNNIMNSRAAQATLVAAVGVASWFGGTYVEKWKHARPKPIAYEIGTPTVEASTIGTSGPMLPSSQTITDNDRLGSVQKRTQEIMKFGFPSLSNIRSFDDYILSYDNRNRIAHWVFEHLTEENIKVKDNVNRSECQFSEDPSIHQFFRSSNDDYYKSGFDRGHLAAAGNHRRKQEHCNQTFYLSNIAPQVGVGFNRDAWNNLEKYARNLTKKYANVYVCTGPIFKPYRDHDGKNYVKYQVIGKNQVAVPTHFFKVIVMETYDDQLHMEAYVMPNQKIPESTPLTTFMVNLEEVEKLSGLLFLNEPIRKQLQLINRAKRSIW